jgi:tetratricopeptide (TPR) repeat protein
VLEALFRIGENDSREQYLEPMGFFGMSLGGMLGRRMTFGSCPEHRYPQAWASVSRCDYISTSLVHEVPELHRCEEPLAVVNVGYTLSSDLSGEHLKDVIGGTVHSLMNIQDYVTKMFDDEPAIFNEIFNAVPMARIEDHRDLYEGDIPNPTRTMGGNSSEMRGSLEAIKDRRHRIVSDPNSDPLDINNAAFQLLSDQFVEEAMVGFDRAASMGQPNALATLIWMLMLQGDPRSAASAFEDYFPRIDDWRARQEEFIQEETYPQTANCMSNAALAYAVLGQTDTAFRLWVEAAADDHIEAKAYPGVLMAREGDVERAVKIMRKLTPDERETFRSDMEEVLEEGSGWFEAWARDALEILNRV